MIVVNDNGRSYTPTIGGLATALTSLRTNPRYEQVLDQVKRRLNAVPGVGPAAYDDAARDEEGPQGRDRPAGALRGPRPEVRRPGRRPRPRRHGAGAVPGQALRRSGHRARASPARASGTTPPSGTRPTSSTPRGPSTSRPARRPRRGGSGPTSSPTRWSGSAAAASDVVAIDRGDDAPGRAAQVRGPLPRAHLRRRHRRAARRDLGRRAGHRRPAPGGRGLRHLPEPGLRPGADGRRAAPVRGHLRPRPRPASPATTAPATTACGTCRSSRSCPGSGSPRPATRPGCASCSTRRSRSTTRRRSSGSPRARRRHRHRGDRQGRRGRRPRRASGRRDVLIVAVGSMAPTAVEVADRLVAQGIGVTVVDPRWVKPVDPAHRRARARATGWW